MKKEIDCSVVKDLLPNYVDHLTSKETDEILENHFLNCAECAKERDEMMGALKMKHDFMQPKLMTPNLDVFLNKTKKMYVLKGILLSMGIIAILVSFIVDIAVNRKLTWSLIVDASIIFSYTIALTAIYSKEKRLIMTASITSVLLLPFLYSIQVVVNKNYLIEPVYWFKPYALPISLVWIGILWLGILIWNVKKLNMWNTFGVLSLLAMVGSAATDVIVSQAMNKKIYKDDLDWIDLLVYLACAIVCFVIGYKRKDIKKL